MTEEDARVAVSALRSPRDSDEPCCRPSGQEEEEEQSKSEEPQNPKLQSLPPQPATQEPPPSQFEAWMDSIDDLLITESTNEELPQQFEHLQAEHLQADAHIDGLLAELTAADEQHPPPQSQLQPVPDLFQWSSEDMDWLQGLQFSPTKVPNTRVWLIR